MMPKTDNPFLAIDLALAERIMAWHQSDDALLKQTIIATSYALQQGHSCLSLDQCLDDAPYNAMATYGYDALPTADEWDAHLASLDLNAADDSPIVYENRRVYLRRYWQFETELADFITHRNVQDVPLPKEKRKLAKSLLDDFFPNQNQQPDWQKVAAANTLFTNLSTIIGGPGTGKTYTVTRILALLANLSDHPLLIKLAAPTGKAAQRLAEAIREAKQEMSLDMFVADAIPNDAQTLHRLLGVIPNSIHFRHDRNNPVEADVLLIDEVSMVDLPLMTRLIRAIKPTTRVILLGDADQLPSVAAGSVLSDLVRKPHPGFSAHRLNELQSVGVSLPKPEKADSVLDNVTELSFSRRFSGNSGIGQLADRVIQGDAKASMQLFSEVDDLTWLGNSDLNQALYNWTQLHYKPIALKQTLNEAFKQLKKFRILCAVRESEQGVIDINERISRWLNINRQPFYKGQPIMVTQNHYGLKLFNGDIGLVWPNEQGQLMVWFEAETEPRAVTPGRLPAHETVYAMTIHKTQGSEFTTVAMILPANHSALLTRELIYTGLTRAKENFLCFGDEKIWKTGVGAKVERWAGLADRIK